MRIFRNLMTIVSAAWLLATTASSAGVDKSNQAVVAITPAPIHTVLNAIPSVITKSNLQPVSPLPATTNLNLVISLPVNDQVALTAFVHDLYDPSSPNYRHFLTPAQFAAQFSPSAAQYQAVIDYAKAQGFTITGVHSNRLVLGVSAPVAKIQSAFNVTMLSYPHPLENRVFYAPSANPTLAVNAPILGISGLDNYSLGRPRLVRMPPSFLSRTGSGPGGTYLGDDFRQAYVPGTTLTGAGQSVGLFELDGYNPSDIQAYAQEAGRPNIPLQNILVDGATGQPSGNGGEVEVCLDIEMIFALSPGVSTIYVYMEPDGSPFVDLLSRMADDNLAKQLSASWGFPGVITDPASEQIFQQMAAQGQSFFTAAGDTDAFNGTNNFPGFPTGSPNIVNVGATTLTTTGPGGAYASETVWNFGNGAGTSGGICPSVVPISTYQQGLNMTLNGGSTTLRNVPDVAFTGDNIDVFADGADQGVAGTSCAAPLWAAFTALVNQQRTADRAAPVGFLNPTFYQIGQGTEYAINFHDIITGNNDNGSGIVFNAVAGYDLCSGWGTPTTNLLNTLVGAAARTSLPTTLPPQHPYDITRNAQFWFTHPESSNALCATLKQAIVVNGGDLKIGFLDLGTTTYWDNQNMLDAEDAVIEALSFYWKSDNVTGEADGTQNQHDPASALCHARKEMAIELIPAIANNVLLGTAPANAFTVTHGVTNYFPADLIEMAGEAAAGTDPVAIEALTTTLKQFNESGITNNFFGDLVECSPWTTSSLRKYAKDPTTQFNCPGLNDSCETARVINGMPFSDSASLNRYDVNSYTNTIPTASCGNGFTGNMAVWTLSPPVAAVNRTFTVQTKGSNISTLLAVWSGTCFDLTPVACTAGGQFGWATLTFTTDGVSTYYITGQSLNGNLGILKLQVTSP